MKVKFAEKLLGLDAVMKVQNPDGTDFSTLLAPQLKCQLKSLYWGQSKTCPLRHVVRLKSYIIIQTSKMLDSLM